MTLALLFDIFVSCLLFTTIIFAVILNRKLSMIHSSRQELQALLDHYSKSLSRAEDGILELRKAAYSIGGGLDEQIKRGGGLKNDLVFLIERGENLAIQLEDTVRKARPVVHNTAPDTENEKVPPEPAPSSSAPESEDQRLTRLLQELR